MPDLSPYAEPEDGAPSYRTGEREAAIVFLSLAIYQLLDTNFSIHRRFRRKTGLYYYSLLFATNGTLAVVIGNIFKNFKPSWTSIWPFTTLLINGGWSVYAPAECLVLYSRLHLVNQNYRLQRWLLWMIIIGSTIVIIPNWVFVFPAYSPSTKISSIWSPRMAIIDRISQAAFTLFELIISSIYITSLLSIMRTKLNIYTRRVMRDLIAVNIIVILMDLLVIILMFLNRTNLAYPLQDFTYAFKYKLEFAVLNQLMAVAGVSYHHGAERKETIGDGRRGKAYENFEARRYQRVGQQGGMLKGYANDDVEGLDLAFDSPKGSPSDSRVTKLQPELSWDEKHHSLNRGLEKPLPVLQDVSTHTEQARRRHERRSIFDPSSQTNATSGPSYPPLTNAQDGRERNSDAAETNERSYDTIMRSKDSDETLLDNHPETNLGTGRFQTNARAKKFPRNRDRDEQTEEEGIHSWEPRRRGPRREISWFPSQEM